MDRDIVDAIYEAAFVPEMWPKVLSETSRLSGSASGTFFVFGDHAPVRGKIGHAPSLDVAVADLLGQYFEEFVAGDSWKTSAVILGMYHMQPASFVHVEAFMTPEQIERDPVRIRLRATGIGAHLCAAIPVPSGELITMVFQRRLQDGPHDDAAVAELDRIQPHFARAGLIAARLGLARAEATVSTLKMLGLPAAVLDRRGRVVASNSLFETIGTRLRPAAFGAIALPDAATNALFQEALAQAGEAATQRVGSVPIAAERDHPAMVVHVLPLRGAAHDVFSGGDIVVAATAVSPSALVPDASILMGLFDLTPAEVKLASALTRGLSLKAAAAEAGIAFSTARSYLERIFAKTGARQQSQLVGLLKGTTPFR